MWSFSDILTCCYISKLRNQMFICTILSSWHQSLIFGGMRVSIHIHQEGRGHEVGGLLGLLIQHVVVGVSDQRPVVGVEEHLIRNLKGNWIFMSAVWKKEYAREQRTSTKVPKIYLKVKERSSSQLERRFTCNLS